ncbi:reticulon-like protein B2 [Selaginella moellendorffii]|uniref:reticulon-like protein B2 n=1 Tax=Selaginella moellendorffii TaxID=88036 RepID=UPI000D1C714E|nr:reticulon-like protein B2 [Selaginella moellendorffii]|eukprot:XP_024541951.1 reticulon-like protein B2 [Selaginella moellendorffii]
MADLADQVSSAVHSVIDSFQSAPQAPPPKASGKKNVHELLGGGKCANVLLWKQKNVSTSLLVGSTVAWFLFEWSGYTLLSLVCNVLLFLIVILFLWATIASLLHRPAPPIPEIVLTEEMVHDSAATLRVEINKALLAAHDVAIGKDFRVFLKVTVVLWILSKLGAWFNFITLVYILVVGAHTIPVIYDKYQDEIEAMIGKLFEEAKKQYSKVDANVLSKIPRSAKKSE